MRDNIMKMKKIKKRGSWTGELALYAFIASLVCTSAGWYRLMAVCDFAFLLFAAMFIWYIVSVAIDTPSFADDDDDTQP